MTQQQQNDVYNVDQEIEQTVQVELLTETDSGTTAINDDRKPSSTSANNCKMAGPVWLASPSVLLVSTNIDPNAFFRASVRALESGRKFVYQSIVPFMVAGAGLVAAGALLENVQNWQLFIHVPETFVLCPALLGLKGNLEMTLASRLSTLAHIGLMENRLQIFRVWTSNLALTQVQAIVVSLIAAIIAHLLDVIHNQEINIGRALLLCAASITSASLASLLLGTLICIVVVVAHRLHLNPDNIATPIAASVGDVTTLGLLVLFGTIYLHSWWCINAIVVGVYVIMLAPLFAFIAARDTITLPVLKHGWYAVVSALFISSGSGYILASTVTYYPGIAIFQPIVNGLGGNLVAIQASRISTQLHHQCAGQMGMLPRRQPLWHFLSPIRAFFSSIDDDARAARILLSMSAPVHLIFLIIICAMVSSKRTLTIQFVFIYLFIALLQVCALLYVCQLLVRLLWISKADPDTNSIPLLTALGDLLGIGLLAIVFVVTQQQD